MPVFFCAFRHMIYYIPALTGAGNYSGVNPLHAMFGNTPCGCFLSLQRLSRGSPPQRTKCDAGFHSETGIVKRSSAGDEPPQKALQGNQNL